MTTLRVKKVECIGSANQNCISFFGVFLCFDPG